MCALLRSFLSSYSSNAPRLLFLFADVGLITSLSSFSSLDAYFAQFLLPAAGGGFPASRIKKVAPPDWENVAKQSIAKTFAVEEVAAV
jgi:hypothetical protein